MRNNNPANMSGITLLREIEYTQQVLLHVTELVSLVKRRPASARGFPGLDVYEISFLEQAAGVWLSELMTELHSRLGITDSDRAWRPIRICRICQYGFRPEELAQVKICPHCRKDYCQKHLDSHVCTGTTG